MTSSGAHTFLARPARVDEIAAIAALFDLSLGALPDRARDLEAQLADSSLNALVVGAGGHLLGAGTYSVCDRAASRRKLHELDVLCRELRGAKAPFGWLESVAVAEGARNWGIGQELLQARLR